MPTNHPRAALVDAAADLNKVLLLSPEIDVKLGATELRDLISEAGTMLRDGDKITAETRVIVDDLLGKGDPESAEKESEVTETAKPEKEAKASAKKTESGKPAKTDAPAKLGKFVPVGRDTPYGAILAVALTGGQTVAEVAEAVNSTEKDVLASLKRGRSNTGIDFAVDGGILSVVLPKGVDAETVWAKAKAAAKGKVTAAAAKAPEAAKAKAPRVASNGTKSRFSDADVIKLRVKENPKKKGSAAYSRFALYEDGMTIAEYVKAGGMRSDLSWDCTRCGFVEVKSAA